MALARSAMEVYDRAVKTVPLKERLTVYELYLARAHEYFGLGKVGSHPYAAFQASCRLESWSRSMDLKLQTHGKSTAIVQTSQ